MSSENITVGELEFPPRKVWLKTYGCQMNYHDSERILYHLLNLGFIQVEKSQDADLIIFNTCAIRDRANQKFYSGLGEVKALKKLKPDLVIGICGCVSQTEGKEIVSKYKQIDFAFGTDTIDNISEYLNEIYAGKQGRVDLSQDQSKVYSIQTLLAHDSPKAFVNIIKGCDNFCSYCIVPFARGREKSRKIDEIYNDVLNLVNNRGIQEIMLLGQNVNSFGKENGETLAELVIELDKIEGLKILRYTTGHPYNLTDRLIELHGSSKTLSRHLHLPIQSGSNTVLERMNRKYTREHYLGLLAKLRKSRPDIVISTDLIVGYPNETEEEFLDTMRLLDEGQFDFIYSYKFSPRKNTLAFKIKDQLKDEIKRKRLRILQLHQLEIQRNIREQLVGKKMMVLVEGKSYMKNVLKWGGRTNCNRLIHFIPKDKEADYRWKWVNLEVISATALSLQGKLLDF